MNGRSGLLSQDTAGYRPRVGGILALVVGLLALTVGGAPAWAQPCEDVSDCDDKNVCTTETCDDNGLCQYAFNTNGCDDGDECTLGDVCAGGECIPGEPNPECTDCNSNGIPDDCDLDCDAPGCAERGDCGGSLDCNSNGVPDECDLACAAPGGVCNTNGFFDECDGDLWRFEFHATVQCLFFELYSNEVRYLCVDRDNQLVRNWIEVGSDYLAVQYPSTDGPSYTAYRFDGVTTTGTDRLIDPSSYVFAPNGGALHFEEQVDAADENEPSWQEWGTTTVDGQFDAAGYRIEGTWQFQSVQPGSVCGDFTAVKLSADCNTNGIPDECEEDCNTNGIADDCELEGNDCNSNGTLDVCDLCRFEDPAGAEGEGEGEGEECSEDCNSNGIPDECELYENDCNSNGIPDECELDENDCNTNGIPDECELDGNDCNGNRIPDECELDGNDCNTNGIPDECDIGVVETALYGAAYCEHEEAHCLFLIDPETGQGDEIGEIRVSGQGPYIWGVTGLAFSSDGTMFASAKAYLYGVSSSDDAPVLLTIDPATAEAQLVGQIDPGYSLGLRAVPDISFDAAGTLFGWGARQSGDRSCSDVLLTIDTGTGLGVAVSANGIGYCGPGR
ncbi:MAG: hypothetical protein GY778_28350, partial [bacterium]|nr:hypothetical protein [bacterium]